MRQVREHIVRLVVSEQHGRRLSPLEDIRVQEAQPLGPAWELSHPRSVLTHTHTLAHRPLP
jgi:hypothetical protein